MPDTDSKINFPSRIFTIILLLLILFCKPGFTQTNEDAVKLGDKYFDEGDYYTASQYYKQVMKKNPSFLGLIYKYAEASRLYFYYSDAEQWYEYIYKNDHRNNFPLSSFWLAMMKKNNGKYVEAKEYFQAFYKKNQKKDDYYSRTAFHEMEACDFALKILKDTLPVEIVHLDSNINTVNTEFGAYPIGDSLLLYSSLRKISDDKTIPQSSPTGIYSPGEFVTKIYQSEKKKDEWNKGKELDERINTIRNHNANMTFSSHLKKYYFTRCYDLKDIGMTCSIYVTEFKNGQWQKPVELNKEINQPGYTSTQPFVADIDSNKTVLFFVSNRPGGIGGLDIWYSAINENKYAPPVNLGDNINTIGNEITPYYDTKTKTLYFSSDWHKGLGGYDVFKSKDSLNNWTKPENMGFPINTSFNDLYFTLNKKDSNGYLTSNRPGSFYEKNITCCNDIFYFKWLKADSSKKKKEEVVELNIPIKKDTINPSETKIISPSLKPLSPITLYFSNDEPDPKTNSTITRENYLTNLNDYISMKNLYMNEYTEGLKDDEKISATKEIESFFDNHINPETSNLEEFTKNLLSHLQNGKTIKLLIQGYCSPLHTNGYNLNLSKRRIVSFENYLKEYNNGIFAGYFKNKKLKLTEEPFGEEKANSTVSDNLKDKRNSVYSPAAALERRIEIKIIDK